MNFPHYFCLFNIIALDNFDHLELICLIHTICLHLTIHIIALLYVLHSHYCPHLLVPHSQYLPSGQASHWSADDRLVLSLYVPGIHGYWSSAMVPSGQ